MERTRQSAGKYLSQTDKKIAMNVEELIRELRKMPKNLEVRYAISKGKGKRTLYGINKLENYADAWVLLEFKN